MPQIWKNIVKKITITVIYDNLDNYLYFLLEWLSMTALSSS